MKIIQEKDIPLFRRRELVISIEHAKKPTPKSAEIIKEIATTQKVDEKLIQIDSIYETYGETIAKIYLKIYKTEEDKLKFESINKKKKAKKEEKK